MTDDRRRWTTSVLAAAVGLAVGGVGTQVLMPVIRQVDPLGLTPVAVVCCGIGAVLGWFLRGCGQRRERRAGA